MEHIFQGAVRVHTDTEYQFQQVGLKGRQVVLALEYEMCFKLRQGSCGAGEVRFQGIGGIRLQ